MASRTLSSKALLLSVCILLLISLSKACHVVDKEALLQFKSKITSDPPNLLQSWTSSSDCCKGWYSVKCDSSTGRVVSLDIKGAIDNMDAPMETIISGTISPYLGNLTSLQVLGLNGLEVLKGKIPQELAKLSQLRELYLSSNKLTGGIPKKFSKLSKLEVLYLDDNQLTGNLNSSVIGTLKSLSILSLQKNKFRGSIPENIGNLKNLSELDLSYNMISGIIPESIGSLSKLTMLDLLQNYITGSIPFSIGKLSSLTYCRLADNMLTGILPSSVGNLKNLKTLNLGNNKLIGRIPPTVAKIPDLALEDNLGLCGSPLAPCKNI